MVLAPKRKTRSATSRPKKDRLSRALYEAELVIVDPQVKPTRSQLEMVLHEEYVETGSTGNTYDRETTLDMMLSEHSGRVVIRDFKANRLGDDTALVTYRSIGGGGQEARRTSVWVRNENRWQLRFHQGTRIPNDWDKAR